MDAFWDSSALVPVCIDQVNTASAKLCTERFGIVVWWATAVEIHSSIARLERLGELGKDGARSALATLDNLIGTWHEIAPSKEVRDQAQALLHLYPLSAADSLQLAAAMIWCRQKPGGRNFISSDARLCDAAAQAGFIVIRPGTPAP